MEAVARRRDMALRCARRRPMIVVGLGEHHGPRAIERAPSRSRLERAERGNGCCLGTLPLATLGAYDPGRLFRRSPSHVPCKSRRPGSRRLYAGHHLAKNTGTRHAHLEGKAKLALHREGGEQHDCCSVLAACADDAAAVGDEHASNVCREARGEAEPR